MNKKKFLESGHFPTLIAAFLYFDVSFMVWVLLGPLAPFLSEMLKLTPYQKGLLTAIPLLGGALFRPARACAHFASADSWLALCTHCRTFLFSGVAVGHRRSKFCRSSADCGTLVSARVSGACHGHRGSRKLRNSHRDAVRAAARSEIWMGEHFCIGHASRDCCAG